MSLLRYFDSDHFNISLVIICIYFYFFAVGEALIGKSASDEPFEEADDVFVEQTAATFSSPPGPVRKRSHSSSSGN